MKKGSKCTPEQIKKNSEVHKGLQAGEKHPMYGKHWTEEQKKQSSEKHKGQFSHNKGKPRSLEANKKQSKSMMGNIPWNKGLKATPEMNKKNSEGHVGLIGPWHNKKRPNMSGENHPLWLGGISFLPYCIKFNKELKEEVRKRDNHTCQNPCCKLTQEEQISLTNQILTIHHIHYKKEDCEPDLITLCTRCHTKSNYDREFHEQFYMNILNNRQLLGWTKRKHCEEY